MLGRVRWRRPHDGNAQPSEVLGCDWHCQLDESLTSTNVASGYLDRTTDPWVCELFAIHHKRQGPALQGTAKNNRPLASFHTVGLFSWVDRDKA